MIYFSLVEGWRNFKNLGIIGLLTICSLTITLVLVGVSLHGYVIVDSWRKGLLGKFEIEAFLVPGVDSTIVAGLEVKINAVKIVNSVSFVTPEQAAKRFSDQFDIDLMDMMGYNPLPSSFIIKLNRSANPASSWQTVSDRVATFKGIDEVVYEGKVLAKIENFYQKSGSVAIISVGVMVIISLIFTILTSIGSIKANEDFIRLIALSGGSRTMAMGPFIVMGGYYGALAGGIAVGIVYFVKLLLLLGWAGQPVVPIVWIPILCGLGILIGVIGAGWSASRKITIY